MPKPTPHPLAALCLVGALLGCSAGEEDVVAGGNTFPGDDAGASFDSTSTQHGDIGPLPSDGSASRVDAVSTTGDGGGLGDGGGGGGGSDAGGRADVPAGPEQCNNGLDDNRDGRIDENCPCTPGTTQGCFPGEAARAMTGLCRRGQQRCEGAGEFGMWSACEGAVVPAADVCNNGLDEDCNGRTDDGPDCCAIAGEGSCYTGPAGTSGVGICRAGRRVCVAGMPPGPCMNEITPRVESCNGIDDNCNGTIDEGCVPCVGDSAGATPWQIHLGAGPTCFPNGRTFSQHGDPGEYQYASIPAETDRGWAAHAPTRISFDDPSTLCGVCECRQGADFTYFQTSFYIPPGYTVSSLVVSIENVDDGVNVAVFNSRHPNGAVDPGSFAYLGGGSTADLARYVIAGRNRIVLTHVDDCCMVRRIAGATIRLNGMPLTQCLPAGPG
ncbi:MAG: hypothetical protein JNK72_04945 [Myxococcales bacterium]|nr:hypothetical protein [Myxococcales bacterium]